MAKNVKILSLRADGHCFVDATDDDGVSTKYSVAVPEEFMGSESDIKDYILAHWPERDLEAIRATKKSTFQEVRASLEGKTVVVAEPLSSVRQRVQDKMDALQTVPVSKVE